MFAAALIVFREVLEASLIVTIIMAATRGVHYRGWWVSGGIAGGVAGACLVAALTTMIADMFDGAGQDIVNAGILFLAVGMIAWHIVWMNKHGREITSNMRAVGQSVAQGRKHMSILTAVVGLAVMREGSEIVLMLQGLWAGNGGPMVMLGGGLLGLGAGIVVSTLMYFGFLVLPLGRVFRVTNVILTLIAAGMAAHGANFLVQAGFVQPFGTRLWDSSALISDQSVLGQGLSALTGYIARPSGIEVACYAATIVGVSLMICLNRQRQTNHANNSLSTHTR
jgi:high-affinity iron transporter